MNAKTNTGDSRDDPGPGHHRAPSVMRQRDVTEQVRGQPGSRFAVQDLPDRQVFSVSAEAWGKLQEVLERPAQAKTKIVALLAEESVLDSG